MNLDLREMYLDTKFGGSAKAVALFVLLLLLIAMIF